jgi:type I restriction enzyme S subunit
MKEYILKDILIERKEYCEKGKEYVHVTLSKEGIHEKTERFDRDFLVKDDNKKYKITRLNDICYNPANLKFGVICLNEYGNAIFSPIYVTYYLKKEYVNEINIKYLNYVLTSSGFLQKVRRYEQGTVYERMAVNSSDFLKMKITIPEIGEQEKIIKVFERINRIIEISRESLKERNKIIDLEFIKMFGNPMTNEKKWNISKLGDLGELKNGMNFNRDEKGYDVKFLGVGDFNKGYILNDLNSLEYVRLNQKPPEEYLLKNNDIIFVRSNGSKELVGRSLIVDNIIEDITYSGFCIRYRNKSSKINPKFLINIFQSKRFFEYLKRVSGGTNINNINQQILSSLKIILPRLEEQEKFIDLVEKLERKNELLKIQLKNYKNLKKCLEQKFLNKCI